jgi:RNA 3'-phosphate cyclase
MIEIDGSYLEGGGAILRVASALSAITEKPMKVFKIRAGRENPGLRAQHLEGLRAVASLCSGRLVNAALGSTEIEFYPEKIRPTRIDVQISTAGAIGLVFQSLKVPICMADGEVIVNVKGGATFGKWAPPLLSTINVLLPTLKKMGYAAEITINRHGFYPVGGAEVEIRAFPSLPVGPNSFGLFSRKPFRPLNLTDRGDVGKVMGISVASECLRKPRVAERQTEAASATLRNKGLETAIQPEYVDSKCAGSGIVLWSTTSTGAILEADSLGERGKPSETVGEEAAKRLLKTMDSGAAVDAHLSDQLLIFMALAAGKSAITAPKLTDHAKTNIYVIQKFLPVEFRITAGTPTLIECSGSLVAA